MSGAWYLIYIKESIKFNHMILFWRIYIIYCQTAYWQASSTVTKPSLIRNQQTGVESLLQVAATKNDDK